MKPMNSRIRRAVDVMRLLYEDHPTGGLLHIVVDDGNVEDGHVAFCREVIEAGGYDDPPSVLEWAMLAVLEALTEDERRDMLRAEREGWWFDEDAE